MKIFLDISQQTGWQIVFYYYYSYYYSKAPVSFIFSAPVLVIKFTKR